MPDRGFVPITFRKDEEVLSGLLWMVGLLGGVRVQGGLFQVLGCLKAEHAPDPSLAFLVPLRPYGGEVCCVALQEI